MDNFLKIHQETMGNEGAASFNPADLGNVVVNGVVTIPTYKGIAPVSHPKWVGWKFITGCINQLNPMPAYGSSAQRNWVKHLNGILATFAPLQTAVLSFYKTNFWDANRLGEIIDPSVAAWIYDHVVNAGRRGIMWAQLAVNTKPDGVMGPVTIGRLNNESAESLLERMEDIAGAFRLDRAHDKPNQIQFLTSWLRRDGQPDTIIAMVQKAASDGRLDDSEIATLKAAMAATA